MSVLIVSSLAKSYDPVDIFAGVTFSIPHRARYAIVGPNGVGKTTLLRIIAGIESASAGSIQISRGISLGYLPQEAALSSENTLWAECLKAFKEVKKQEAELKALEGRMSQTNISEEKLSELMSRYGVLQAEFEHNGGYTYQLEIEQVLTGLGFSKSDYDYPLPHLSGGQRTRALLARLLLSKHDLLLLDEPTNHLDIDAVEWLEAFLKDWSGAALIVSHDRYFIDRVATHILEMDRGIMETYRGNYSAYLGQRENRWEQRIEFFNTEKARLENELDYIKRNIAGQNVAQAKGRLRRLSRYLQAVEQIGFEGVKGKKWMEIADETAISHTMGVAEAHDRIKALSPPSYHHHDLKLQLKPKRRSGKIILRTKSLKVGYPNNPLFQIEDIEFHRLECAAIIGPNGSGKSSFLKTILGDLEPIKGHITLGASLDIAYFAQAHEGLDAERSLMEEIDTMAPSMLPGEVRKYLARFLFSGEDVFKKVLVLSGGERGRLALAKLALTDANLLLLDEPTNHLDIPAQEILQNVLANFDGTLILVSHDRYLIQALATQIWSIDPKTKTLEVFKGTYQEYRDQTAAEVEIQSRNSEASTINERVVQAKEKNRQRAEERRRKTRLSEVETLITILEEKLQNISDKLANPPTDTGKVQKLGEDYVETENTLNSLLAEWETLHG